MGNLNKAETDIYLRAMHGAFVEIRVSCWNGDLKRAEDIADAFHNLPLMTLPGHESETPEGFWKLFLEPLLKKYPALRERFSDLVR